jgi:hypothetical protein
MLDPEPAIAATFVEPRGMIRSIVASVAGREVLGCCGGCGCVSRRLEEDRRHAGTTRRRPSLRSSWAPMALISLRILNRNDA